MGIIFELLGKISMKSVCFLIILSLAIAVLFNSCSEDSIAPDKEELYKNARIKMVQEQLEGRDIKDKNVLQAFSKVKRHFFVLPEDRNYAYSDRPLPIGYGQDLTRPYLTALMTELAGIKKDYKVLEIGTGSGYHTAILAELAREVYTVEILEPLYSRAKRILNDLDYKNVKFKLGDGYLGWKEYAPYDVIIVSIASQQEPQPLIEQLKTGGRMIIPIGEVMQELVVIEKGKDSIKRERIIPVRFMPMTREGGQELKPDIP
jgi:protein-L-isoaspartate(D-aspartate) O-methyltransferase